MSLDEWRRVFFALGKSPYWVTLSGGEPFLRQDLTKIVQNLCRICQPKMITIPTNGLLTDKILTDVIKMVKVYPETYFIINLSLDGMGEKHDRVRGVKGNFKKSLATFTALRKIKSANFILGLHTVISRENIHDFPEIANFVLDKLRPDSYITEIAENRVELDNVENKITPDIGDYKKAIRFLKTKMGKQKLTYFTKITQTFRITYYDLVAKILEKQKQIIPCYAGIASVQIAPNGDVWPCCVRADILGNLKENNFDFEKIWFSLEAKKVRRSIKSKECYCPLANVSYTNILLNPRQLSRVMINYFQKWSNS